MVKFVISFLLTICVSANVAVAQNPFKIFDIFSGSEKKTDTTEDAKSDAQAESVDAPELKSPSSRTKADDESAPTVDRVESIDSLDAPPFPQSNPQSNEDGTKSKADNTPEADSKPAKSIEELPAGKVTETKPERDTPQPAIPPAASDPAPSQPNSPNPISPQPDFAANSKSDSTPQSGIPATPRQAKSGETFFGATVNDAQRDRLGIEIVSVSPNSPAAIAGIRAGDRLIMVAGSQVSSRNDFQQLINILSPGDRIEIELMRGRKKESTVVSLVDRQEYLARNTSKRPTENQPRSNQSSVAQASNDVAPSHDDLSRVVPADERMLNQADRSGSNQNTTGPARLGVVVVDGVEESRNGFRREVRTGAAVESVSSNSPAATAGIPVGALIVAANGRRVETSTDLVEYISTLRPGERVELALYVNSQFAKVPVVLGEATAKTVRQAADFQPVPGNTGLETAPVAPQPERPILNRLGERFPRLRRVENVIEQFSEKPEVPADPRSTVSPQSTQPVPSGQQLEQTVRQQREEIEALNRRLRALESRRRR